MSKYLKNISGQTITLYTGRVDFPTVEFKDNEVKNYYDIINDIVNTANYNKPLFDFYISKNILSQIIPSTTIIDIPQPEPPPPITSGRLVASFTTAVSSNTFLTRNFAYGGDYIYITNSVDEIVRIDINNPSQLDPSFTPIPMSSIPDFYTCYGYTLEVYNNALYIVVQYDSQQTIGNTIIYTYSMGNWVTVLDFKNTTAIADVPGHILAGTEQVQGVLFDSNSYTVYFLLSQATSLDASWLFFIVPNMDTSSPDCGGIPIVSAYEDYHLSDYGMNCSQMQYLSQSVTNKGTLIFIGAFEKGGITGDIPFRLATFDTSSSSLNTIDYSGVSNTSTPPVRHFISPASAASGLYLIESYTDPAVASFINSDILQITDYPLNSALPVGSDTTAGGPKLSGVMDASSPNNPIIMGRYLDPNFGAEILFAIDPITNQNRLVYDNTDFMGVTPNFDSSPILNLDQTNLAADIYRMTFNGRLIRSFDCGISILSIDQPAS